MAVEERARHTAVVERNADLLEMYERVLRRLGKAVIKATTRRAALETIGRAAPLAIVIKAALAW